jgi:hypothetical protein
MRIVSVGRRFVMASAVGVWILAGTPYAYRVDALFDGARGVGNRTEVRPCSLTFINLTFIK